MAISRLHSEDFRAAGLSCEIASIAGNCYFSTANLVRGYAPWQVNFGHYLQ